MERKSKLLYGFIPVFLAPTLVGCYEHRTFTVKFNCNDIKETIPEQKIKYGKLATRPTITPTAKGGETKIFDNYYLPESKTAFDFNTPIKSNITIDARIKDYTHTVTFDPDGLTKEARKVKVLHNRAIPTEELEKHTPKSEDQYFYAWLDKDDELFNVSTPITQDITLKPGLVNATITFTPTGSYEGDSFNLDPITHPHGKESIKFEAQIDGQKITPSFNQWKILPGYEDLIEISDPGDGTIAVNAKSENITKGSIAYIYLVHEKDGQQYIGALKLGIGHYDYLDESSMKLGFASKTDALVKIIDGKLIIPPEYYDKDDKRWVNLTTISSLGFKDIDSLKSVVLSDYTTYISLNAFEGCTNLADVTLNDGLTYISNDAFAKCTALKNIYIPGTVNYIGEHAFFRTSLETAEFAKTDSWTYSNNNILINKQLLDDPELAARYLTSIYSDSYIKRNEDSKPLINIEDITLEKNDMYESYCDLYSNQDVTCVSGDENIATIEDGHVVARGAGTTTITVVNPQGQIEVGVTVNPTAMLEDKKISTTKLHGGIGVKDGESTNLKYLAIPSTIKYNDSGSYKTVDVTAIADNGFNTCSNLTNAYISNKIESIGESAFLECDDLETVEFAYDNKVCTKIGENAFKECYGLNFINLPNSITEIGNNAFEKCQLLNRIALPKNLKEISAECFLDCISLHTVTIPKSVTKIGSKAFFRCDRFYNVYYEGTVDEFEKIEKDTTWCYDTPLEVVHCSDKDWERH